MRLKKKVNIGHVDAVSLQLDISITPADIELQPADLKNLIDEVSPEVIRDVFPIGDFIGTHGASNVLYEINDHDIETYIRERYSLEDLVYISGEEYIPLDTSHLDGFNIKEFASLTKIEDPHGKILLDRLVKFFEANKEYINA